VFFPACNPAFQSAVRRKSPVGPRRSAQAGGGTESSGDAPSCAVDLGHRPRPARVDDDRGPARSKVLGEQPSIEERDVQSRPPGPSVADRLWRVCRPSLPLHSRGCVLPVHAGTQKSAEPHLTRIQPLRPPAPTMDLGSCRGLSIGPPRCGPPSALSVTGPSGLACLGIRELPESKLPVPLRSSVILGLHRAAQITTGGRIRAKKKKNAAKRRIESTRGRRREKVRGRGGGR